MCTACSKRHAIDWNDASLRGYHVTDVGELYVDGIGIGLNVVPRAVYIEKWPLHPVSAIAC